MNKQQKKTVKNSEEIHNNLDELNSVDKPIQKSIKEVEEHLNNKTDNFTWKEWLSLFIATSAVTYLINNAKQIKNTYYRARTMNRLQYAVAGGGITNEQYIKEITKANFYQFAAKAEKDMRKSLEDSLKTSYYKKIYNTQVEIGMYFQVSNVDYSVLNQSWGKGKWKYSEAVWKDTEEVANRLNKLLIKNIKEGKRVKDLRKEFTDLTDLGNHAIDRLLITETTRAINEGLIQAFIEEGVKQVQYIAVLDLATCEICQSLDLEIFDIDKIKSQPPVHPRCRCVLVAYNKYIEGLKRRARDKDGKYISIPANMSYAQWYKTYIKVA